MQFSLKLKTRELTGWSQFKLYTSTFIDVHMLPTNNARSYTKMKRLKEKRTFFFNCNRIKKKSGNLITLT